MIIETLTTIVKRLFAGNTTDNSVNNSVVDDLDIERYLGDWYEIARYDHPFERGIEHSRAHYGMRPDGTISVTNTGIKNGKTKIAHGKAKRTDKAARLRVSFFCPFYSDYRVMSLDADYQYALVGSKSSKYLWILARTPRLTSEAKATILAEAQRRGYDTGKLIWVEQSK